jgi:hypothetical protein
MKANPSPSKEINHHLTGSRYGAKQASRKIIATNMFTEMKKRFANKENLAAIAAI